MRLKLGNSPDQSSRLKVEAPLFSGDNVLTWIFQMDKFFAFHQTPGDQRLNIAPFYMTGVALNWYYLMHHTSQFPSTWEAFTESLKLRFLNPETTRLYQLTQTSTGSAYIAEFEALVTRTSTSTTGLKNLVDDFISGLRDNIKRELLILKPCSLSEAMSMAKLVEAGKLQPSSNFCKTPLQSPSLLDNDSYSTAEELSVVNSVKVLQRTSNEISLRAVEGTLVPPQGTISDDKVTGFVNGGGSTFIPTFVSTRFETHMGLFQEARSRSCSYDFISQMPDEILVMILSCFPIRDAVVTSILSTRWRFVWRNLIQLNFKGSSTERDKYINQVNSVIQSYNHQIVQDFRIHFNLNNHHKKSIDEWLQFAANKRVEFLELDLGDRYYSNMNDYEFPSRLSERNLSRSNAAVVVELVYLRKLILTNVNLSEAVLQELLSNSPNLETLAIKYSLYLDHIRIGGRAINLKHFKISESAEHEVKSIYLSDFDLESFEYIGSEIDLRLASLPKLKKVDMGYVWWSNDNVFDQLLSCASSLTSLSINLCRDENNIKPYSFHELPNVKQLRMKLRGREHNCLLDLASIVNACPNMESFKIETCWTTPIVSRRKARDATNPHQHLKLFEIVKYYGRKCDFELAAYIIQTAVALEKIVITVSHVSKYRARSSAKRLESILPPGVELVTL